MNVDRRKFLQQLTGVCSAGFARRLGLGVLIARPAVALAPVAATAVSATAAIAGASAYGAGVRRQVFEVIVRQAIAGAPWQEICKGPMIVNNITEDEIKAEIARRKSPTYKDQHTERTFCYCADCRTKILNRNRQYTEMLAAIPHCDRSPCGCQACQASVRKAHKVIHDKIFNDA